MKKKIFIIVAITIIFIAALLTVFSGFNKNLNAPSGKISVSPLERDLISPISPSTGLSDASYESGNKAIPERAMSMEANSDLDVPMSEKKVIKTANLNMKVSSVDKASESVNEVAKNNGGTVFSSNIRQNNSKIKSGTITLKVPFDKFEKTISEIKKIAVLVLNESTSGSDVTEQYVDLEAQLKNKLSEEATFARILENAQKIDDVLAVTRELSRTRGEIERIEGRIRYMDSQTDMSTITVNLSEDPEITFSDTWRPFQVMKDTINGLFKDFQKFIVFLIVLIIRIIPIFALYGVIAFLIYKISKKIYEKTKYKKTNLPQP